MVGGGNAGTLKETCPRCHGAGGPYGTTNFCYRCHGVGRIERGTHSPESAIDGGAELLEQSEAAVDKLNAELVAERARTEKLARAIAEYTAATDARLESIAQEIERTPIAQGIYIREGVVAMRQRAAELVRAAKGGRS